MSCCGNLAGRKIALSATCQESTSNAAEIADARAPARILFRSGRSHAGTHTPAIPHDGEGLVRTVRVKPFAVDAVPVTNTRFAAFVEATGYVTEAERFGWSSVFCYLLPDPEAVPPAVPDLPWWVKCDGACWHRPEGPTSGVLDRADHPVVHVSWLDAKTFAAWAEGRLPTEAEWEHAARGGLGGDPRFPWGDKEPNDTDFLPANIWQGRFPLENTCADGWLGTSPVGSFPPNGAGLYDMVGNVWEWTCEAFRIRSESRTARMRNDLARVESQKVMKGGSFLCHLSYCYRYRIAARSGTAADSGSSNTGFRVFYDDQGPDG
jgi:formylglycine-generating enzyme